MNMLFFFLSLSAVAQDGFLPKSVSIAHDPVKKVFIKNDYCHPISVFVNEKTYVVEAKSELSLGVEKWSEWYFYTGTPGSLEEKTVPSPLEKKQDPDQGAGTGIHTGTFQHAYDFYTAEGTKVHAVEDGFVVRVVEQYELAHQDKNKMNEVNQVNVLHADGSFTEYLHLKKDSVVVKLCEKVKAGELIALSGNTGFSSGPHLHVHAIRPLNRKDSKTFPLKFTKWGAQ